MPPFFAEIARVLRPGGHVVSSPPAPAPRRPSTRPSACSRAACESGASRRSQSGEAGAGTYLVARKLRSSLDGDGDPRSQHAADRQPVRGGRPQPEAAARGRAGARACRNRVPHRARPRASTTACEEAPPSAEAGEPPVVMSGDGLIGQIGGVLAGDRDSDGRSSRAAAATTSPACSGSRPRPPRRSPRHRGRRDDRRSTSARSTASASSASRAAGSTPTPTGSPTRRSCVKGGLVYAYAALRALAAWKPATFTLDARRRAASTRSRGYSVAVANSKAYGGGMFIAPDAELDDGLLDVVTTGEVGKLRFLANLPKVFKGTHVENAEIEVARAPRGRIERRPPVRRLRRRRAPHRPARRRSGAPARAARDRPGRLSARALARVRRQGGRSPARPARSAAAAGAAAAPRSPAGCCCGWRPTRSSVLGARLGGGSTRDQRRRTARRRRPG